MPFTEKITLAVEKLVGDQWGTTGRTVEYQVLTATLLNADRDNGQVWTISGTISAQVLTLAPLGISAAAMLMVLCTDFPVDVRTNAPSDPVFLSGVTLWAMQGIVSNLYITTGSADTTLWLKAVGGSNATAEWKFPNT